MARLIEARVIQKAGTIEELNNNDLKYYDGEQVFVKSDVDDNVISYKVGANGKKFNELPYPDFYAKGKVTPSSVFSGLPSGVYIPTLNGLYNGTVTVNLGEGYQVLHWDGSTLQKVVYPFDYNGIVFGGVIDDSADLSNPTEPIWYIASAGEYNTVPSTTLSTTSILTWDGVQWSHIPFDLEVRGEFLVADTMDEMRSITPQVAQLLVNGTYKGITLLGYYEKGDTPAPIEYFISSTSDIDNGGSIIEINSIKFEHKFTSINVNSKYFGIIGDGTTISNDKFLKISKYCLDNNRILLIDGNVLLKNTTTNLIDYMIGSISTTIGSKLIIDGMIRLNTSQCDNLLIDNFDIETVNMYGDLNGYRGFVSIIYSNSTSNSRRVIYRNITINSIVPLSNGENRSNTFILENGFSFGEFRNITSYNVEGVINIGPNTANYIISDVITYNAGFSVWVQEGSTGFKIDNVKLVNTPQQADNWTNKNGASAKGRSGFDTLLIDGDNCDFSNIYAYNPIERCIYCKASYVNASNLYCLNGDGFKFVGKSSTKISKNINVRGTTFIIDDTYLGSYNFSHSHIYWVDGINISDVSIINNSTSNYQYLRSFGQLEYTASNVSIDNVKVVGKGYASSFLWLILPKEALTDYIVWKNISIANCNIIREGNRQVNSLFSRITSGADPTGISSITMDGLVVKNNEFFYSNTAQRDDFIYSWEGIKNMIAENNSMNRFGFFNAGFLNFSSDYNTRSENILLKENNLRFGHIDNAFNRLNEFVLAKGSYLNFIMDDNIELNWFFTNTGNATNNAIKKMKFRNRNYAILNISNHNAIITLNDARGYFKSQIIGGSKTDIIGVLPNVVQYTTPNIAIRGDLYTKPFDVSISFFRNDI